jgi:acetoin utilization protein AcuB
MNVKHFMTKEVITVTKETRVTDAVDLMERNNFHRLPVVENETYIGLVTDEEIAENSPSSVTSLSIYEMNYLFDKMTVGEIMTKQTVTVSPDTLLEEAATIMNDKNVTVLPVLDDSKHVVGILTYKDIFKALIDLSGYNGDGFRFLIYIDEDRVGVLAHITRTLADANISLSHIFVNRLDNQIEITIQTTDRAGKETETALKKAGYNISPL